MKKYILALVLLLVASAQVIAQDLYFGNYRKPALLVELEWLKIEKLEGRTRKLEALGFFIDYKSYHTTTPLDVIVFAATRQEGIHFGFLTDFGTQPNLDEAPIVLISPTSDPAPRIVAANLREFLGLAIVLKQVDALAYINSSEEEGKIREAINTNRITDSLHIKEIENLERIFKRDLGVVEINNIYNYMHRVREQRNRQINISTIDGMGIIQPGLPGGEFTEFNYRKSSPRAVRKFLTAANKASRLKFYREATHYFVLSKGYDEWVRKQMLDYLERDGLQRERRLLEQKY
jgi:hypothetical protein